MKRRTKRELGLLIGAILILAGIVFFNTQLKRGGLAEEMDRLRRQVEAKRAEEGLGLLSWGLVRQTRGSLRGGGTYAEELRLIDGQPVNLIGFMVPQEQFRDVTEFLLLPIPIECYFCQSPPPRDVMLIQLAQGETANIYKEPILINGILNIHEGPNAKFFYSIQEAELGVGDTDGELTKRSLELQHMLPQHEPDPNDLLPAYTPPPESE